MCSSSDPFGLCPKGVGGDGKTDTFTDCTEGSSGWYANREATGQGNSVINNVGGALASCSESWLCQGVLAVASLGSSLLESGSEAAASGASSLYEDVTETGSPIANRFTDVKRADFEGNLLKSGFSKTVSKDGLATLFEKDGVRYAIRAMSKSTQGPTAEMFVNGVKALKIRIQP
jgi:hypothetical protein